MERRTLYANHLRVYSLPMNCCRWSTIIFVRYHCIFTYSHLLPAELRVNSYSCWVIIHLAGVWIYLLRCFIRRLGKTADENVSSAAGSSSERIFFARTIRQCQYATYKVEVRTAKKPSRRSQCLRGQQLQQHGVWHNCDDSQFDNNKCGQLIVLLLSLFIWPCCIRRPDPQR